MESIAAPRSGGSDQQEVFLLAWNPDHFSWEKFPELVATLRSGGPVTERWTTGSRKQMPTGSRVYLMRVGREPRGLIGSGATKTPVAQGPRIHGSADGAIANFVEVEFDHLQSDPVIRRDELEGEPFTRMHWDIQGSGVKVDPPVANELKQEWSRRITAPAAVEPLTPLPARVLDAWRERRDAANKDAAWVEYHRDRDQERSRVLPEIRELLDGFLGGDIGLGEFRSEFDKKTRNEWDLFGFKGQSGAMLVNQIAKHLPGADDTERALRKAMRLPSTTEDGRRAVGALIKYLEEQRESGTAGRGALQPGRVPFLLSACWHVQATDVWPVYYVSARQAFERGAVYRPAPRKADDFISFVRAYRSLASGLELTFWELEHLCSRLGPEADPADELIGDESAEAESQKIWLVAPGAGAQYFEEFVSRGIFAIGWDYLGDLSRFEDMTQIYDAIRAHEGLETNPTQSALMVYNFIHELKDGDIVFAKRGRDTIIGYGTITSEYRYETDRPYYQHVRGVDWHLTGEWKPRDKPFSTKTLTEIGKYPSLVSDIRRELGLDQDAESEPLELGPRYEMEDAVAELFVGQDLIEEGLLLLRYKKNVVLQGPPGVGKTFFAKRLAYLLVGEKDPSRIEQVQFHPSYSYEDFVQGFRPVNGGDLGLADGPFLRFCDQALQDPDSPYVMIIDEINRGNLSKVFGELMLLIESDKRSEAWGTTLTYARGGEGRFHVPPNVYLVGTMNTADRSLAMVDYALRRRFAFVDVRPSFESQNFERRLGFLGVDQELVEEIRRKFAALNQAIREDHGLGESFEIGHSYFCQTGAEVADRAWFERIVRTEIRPLLREYWFDDAEKVDAETSRLLAPA